MRGTAKVTALCAVAVVAVVGGIQAANAGHKAKKPIVIGMPIAATGFIAPFDDAQKAGAVLAVKQINAGGGVLGRPLKLIFADTKSDIVQGTNAADEVISQGAQFLVPTFDYTYGGNAAREGQKKGIISITGAGDSRFGLKGIGDLVFNVVRDTQPGASAATFAAKVKKWRRAYILGDTSIAVETKEVDSFNYTWQKLGGSIAGRDAFLNTDASVATQIARIKQAASNADFLLLASYPPGGVSALKQIRAAGITLPVILSGTFDGTGWTGAVSMSDLKDVYVNSGGLTTPNADPDPTVRRIMNDYVKANGAPPTNGTATLIGYSSIQAFAIAIGKAKSTNTAKVKVQLERFRSVPLAHGAVTWTPKCHVTLSYSNPYYVYTTPTTEKFVARVTPGILKPSLC